MSPQNPLCPDCGHPFQPGKPKCLWCGADLSKVALPDLEFTCPCCDGQKLNEHRQGEWLAHVCPKCGGAFLSSAMMDKLEAFYADTPIQPGLNPPARLPESELSPEAELYRKCPQCSQMMARRRYRRISDVVVDECLGHGYWLDPTELQRIVQFLKSGGLKKTAAFETKQQQLREQASKELQRVLRRSTSYTGL